MDKVKTLSEFLQSQSITVNEDVNSQKKDYVDQFLDIIYLVGTKEDGKYCLTLTQAEEACGQMYDYVTKNYRNDPE